MCKTQILMLICDSINHLSCLVGSNFYAKVMVILFWYHKSLLIHWFHYFYLNLVHLLLPSRQFFNVIERYSSIVTALSWLCASLFSEG